MFENIWVKSRKCSAFTLTEVLIAIAIVGVIAALVLPTIVTKYQNNVYEHMYNREVNTIEDSIKTLAVNENKVTFFDTMMYSDTEPISYEDNAGKYMKKYLRIAKYCGDNNTTENCFAKNYYEYNNGRKDYTPVYKGACAILKNGVSICMIPQVNANSITGIIDLNGAKGPNVLGRDLREFTISPQYREGRSTTTSGIIATEIKPIEDETTTGGEEEDPCAGKTCGCGTLPDCDPCTTDPNGLDCCKKSFNKTKCCTYSYFKDDSRCKKTKMCSITAKVYDSSWGMYSCGDGYVLSFYRDTSDYDCRNATNNIEAKVKYMYCSPYLQGKKACSDAVEKETTLAIGNHFCTLSQSNSIRGINVMLGSTSICKTGHYAGISKYATVIAECNGQIEIEY